MNFFEDLATLCAREMNAARKDGDEDRMAGVVETLATLLGRSAAMAAGGDAKGIDTLLEGSSNHALEEASSFAPLIEISTAFSAAPRKDPQERLREAAKLVREHLGVRFYDMAQAGEVEKALAEDKRSVMDVLKELSGEKEKQDG